MRKFDESSNCVINSTQAIKNVMMQGMFYKSDGEISVGYLGEEGDICHACARREFVPQDVDHFISYASAKQLLSEIYTSCVSYGVLSIGRIDKGCDFNLLNTIKEQHCFIKKDIIFLLDQLRLYSRKSEEPFIRTVYIPMSSIESEWKPVDGGVNVCYTPTLYAAVSTSSQREGTAILTHSFAAETYRLHEAGIIDASFSSSALRHVIIGRTMPVIANGKHMLIRKEMRKGVHFFDVLNELDSRGFDVERIDTQDHAAGTRLYITGICKTSLETNREILAQLGISEDELLGAY